MFLLPGRGGTGGGGSLSQRGAGASGSNGGPLAGAGAGAGGGPPGPDAGAIVQERDPPSPAVQQSRRQDMMRLIMIVLIVMFMFDGDKNGGSPSKPSTADVWAHNHVVLPEKDILNLKSVLFVPGDGPVSPVNVTGVFRGSWRPLAAHVPPLSPTPASSNGTAGAISAIDSEGGSTILQLEEVMVEGLPEVALLFGMMRAYTPPHEGESPKIEFSLPVQGALLMRTNELVLFSTPVRSQRLAWQVAPRADAAEAEAAVLHGMGASFPAADHPQPDDARLYMFVRDTVNDSANSSRLLYPLEDKLSARFKFLQLRTATHSLCHYSARLGWAMEGGKASGMHFQGRTVVAPPCSRQLSVAYRVYDLHYDTLRGKADWYSIVMVLALVAQLALTVLQLRHSAQPAMAARTSILTVLAQSLLDAVVSMFHMMLSAALPTVFFGSLMWVSLLQLLLFSVFQMRLVVNTYKARFAQEIAVEGWRGLRARMINLHLRFYAALLLVLLFAFSFPSRPLLTLLALYSFWWPQIWVSAYSGRRHPFHPLYLLGTSVLRLLLPLYLLVCPRNFVVLMVEYFSPQYDLTERAAQNQVVDHQAALILVAYVGVQVAILHLQTRLGPRFFVPSGLLPQKYDYHRSLPAAFTRPVHVDAASAAGTSSVAGDDSDGAGPGIALSLLSSVTGARSYRPVPTDETDTPAPASGPSTGLGDVESGSLVAPTECVICYNSIHLHLREQYMITPCDHLFHEECLQQWMRVKLECPVCRAALPALDEDE